MPLKADAVLSISLWNSVPELGAETRSHARPLDVPSFAVSKQVAVCENGLSGDISARNRSVAIVMD